MQENVIMNEKKEKKSFLLEILVKFDFLLLKGRQKFEEGKEAKKKQQYLVPLLFPKNKPRSPTKPLM